MEGGRGGGREWEGVEVVQANTRTLGELFCPVTLCSSSTINCRRAKLQGQQRSGTAAMTVAGKHNCAFFPAASLGAASTIRAPRGAARGHGGAGGTNNGPFDALTACGNPDQHSLTGGFKGVASASPAAASLPLLAAPLPPSSPLVSTLIIPAPRHNR